MSDLKNPMILTTNRLLDGDVVFFGEKGWTDDIQQAMVVHDKAQLESIEKKAQISVDNNEVIGFYAIDVAIDKDNEKDKNQYHIEPIAIREKIRVTGPTIDYVPDDSLRHVLKNDNNGIKY